MRFNPLVKHTLVVILDQRTVENDRQLDTSGKVPKIKKTTPLNNFASSGPGFLSYLKTLLYGYVTYVLTRWLELNIPAQHERRTRHPMVFAEQRTAILRRVWGTRDRSVLTRRLKPHTHTHTPIRDANMGGMGKVCIAHADSLIRQEWHRLTKFNPVVKLR